MKITRRSFLGTVGGAALWIIGFLYPGIQAFSKTASESPQIPSSAGAVSATELRQMNGPDPTYAGGEVVEKTLEGVILKSDTGVRAVRIPAETAVWKEFDVKPDVIQLHDWLDVKGTPLADGTLLAHSGWVFVNIGRRNGFVEDLSADSLVLRTAKGTERIELSSRLEVISAHDGKPLPGGVAALRRGAQIGMVGLRLPNGGFRATRIWSE